MRTLITNAIDDLCSAFERNGYNPTPIVDIGVLVAAADGRVDGSERAILLDVFQTLLGTTLTPEVVDHMVSASLEVIEAAGSEPRARHVGVILNDCDAVESGILVALGVAFASDGLSGAELSIIEKIAAAAELPKARFGALVSAVRAKADSDPSSVRSTLSGPSLPRS